MTVAADYLETQVLTASPQRLHLMVVDAALRSGRRGLEAMEQQRWEAVDAAFSRCRACVLELFGGLKPDAAPDLVSPLKLLFVFVYRNLIIGELERDPEQIGDALRILEQHRETWLALDAQLRSASPTVPTPHAREWLG